MSCETCLQYVLLHEACAAVNDGVVNNGIVLLFWTSAVANNRGGVLVGGDLLVNIDVMRPFSILIYFYFFIFNSY